MHAPAAQPQIFQRLWKRICCGIQYVKLCPLQVKAGLPTEPGKYRGYKGHGRQLGIRLPSPKLKVSDTINDDNRPARLHGAWELYS